jgi:amino acid permease
MEMKDPRFKKFQISLMWAMYYVTFLYHFVGIIGYLSFLDETKGNIVL